MTHWHSPQPPPTQHLTCTVWDFTPIFFDNIYEALKYPLRCGAGSHSDSDVWCVVCGHWVQADAWCWAVKGRRPQRSRSWLWWRELSPRLLWLWLLPSSLAQFSCCLAAACCHQQESSFQQQEVSRERQGRQTPTYRGPSSPGSSPFPWPWSTQWHPHEDRGQGCLPDRFVTGTRGQGSVARFSKFKYSNV